VGACLSVTALPVIAHVLLERGELNSRVGGIAIACSAVASVAMFTYIALATAVSDARGYAGFLVKLGLIVVAAVGVRFLLRPVVRWLVVRSRSPGGGVTPDTMAVVFSGLFLFALAADRIGVNLMVGAFVWGVVMPANRAFRLALAGRLADVARVLLLPVFFAYSGLFTDLRLLTPSVLSILAVVLVASVVSKFTAALPGRLYGMSWRETFELGALMNTRGLVLLVVGLIGLELGIITQATYTILVVVALITNLMTGPLMDALAVRRGGAQGSDLGGAAVSQVAEGF
jgi:Kef-type K+ transport system membrane component KefB